MTGVQTCALPIFQNNIKHAIEEDENRHSYFLDEMPVGKTSDGKTLYRKEFKIEKISDDGAVTTLNINIQNLDKVIDIRGGFDYHFNNNIGYVPFNFYNVGAKKGTSLYFNGSSITYISEFEGENGRIILEYTKTTN